MTLHELWLVIARRWRLMVLVPVVCAVACFAYLALHESGAIGTYTATSRIVVNSQVQGVAGLAASEGRQYLADLYGGEVSEDGSAMEITAKGSSDTMTVTITVKGSDEAACVQAANEVAEAAERGAEAAYADQEDVDFSTRVPYAGKVELATIAEVEASVDSGGGLKYLLVAVLGGLFVAICIAVVLDMMKRPVKTAESVQDAVELPVLEVLPAKSGERLLANVRFAAKKDDLTSVYVVPAGDMEAARVACDLLAKASADEGAQPLSVECGAPLSETMRSAYDARERDAVVVAVRQWTDTLPQLESTVAELRLADANLVGLVFAKGKLT